MRVDRDLFKALSQGFGSRSAVKQSNTNGRKGEGEEEESEARRDLKCLVEPSSFSTFAGVVEYVSDTNH